MSADFWEDDSDRDEVILDINTTPLIDVMLVLLIMLIVTIPLVLNQVPVNFAQSASAQVKNPAIIAVDVDADGRICWGGTPIAAAGDLDLRMGAAKAASSSVQLRVHEDAQWSAAVAVMAAAERQSLGKFAIVDGKAFQTSCR